MHGSRLDAGVFRELARGTIPNRHVFLDSPQPGPSPYYVICNSVPKAGTYLLVELVRALGGHVDLGYHTYTSSISKLNPDGSLDYGRALPAPLWASALRSGYFCASHTEYCPYLEQYLLGRPEHKMLFIVRDPRDIVVSWVDFVYHSASYPKMRKWNAYLRAAGSAAHPDDASRITSTRSCPIEWCSWHGGSPGNSGTGRAGQPATAGRPAMGSSLKGPMVSSVM